MEKINIYQSPAQLAQSFGDYLVRIIKGKEQKNIALSGGSTPKILFDYLAEKYPDAAMWQNVHFYWGDERCVPPDNDDSNYKMSQDHLFSKIKIPFKNIHRIMGEEDPEQEANRYSSEIRENLSLINGWPSFDLIILGMGNDGHTASIFPQQMELLVSEKTCEVAVHPNTLQKRITLTGKSLNNAKEIAFLITGEAKKEKISEIIDKTGNYETYPAFFIKPAHGKLLWFLEKGSAQNLKRAKRKGIKFYPHYFWR